VPLYTRRQVLLILLLTGAAAAGLGIDRWRRARPELVEQLETADRDAPPALRPAPTPTDLSQARPPAARVDVNRASEADLASLPGVGPTLAARIVAARPFNAVDELRRVRGLRRTTLDRIRPLVTTSP
jgi:DNA uptake protein ComE-like DNA-binding protein